MLSRENNKHGVPGRGPANCKAGWRELGAEPQPYFAFTAVTVPAGLGLTTRGGDLSHNYLLWRGAGRVN